MNVLLDVYIKCHGNIKKEVTNSVFGHRYLYGERNCQLIKMARFCWPKSEYNRYFCENLRKEKIKDVILFSSVTQSHLTLCDPMDCSTLGFPVFHYLLTFSQTYMSIESMMPSNHFVEKIVHLFHHLLSRSQSEKGYILYDSNFVIYWKMKNYRANRKIKVSLGLEGMGREMNWQDI